MPELRHLPVSDRREFWRYCQGQAAPISIRHALLLGIPTSVVLVAYFTIFPLATQSSLLSSLLRLVLLVGLVAQIMMIWWFHRSRLRSALDREVLAQFFDRKLPESVEVRCPNCGYNLTARTPSSAKCPECGAVVYEAQ